MWEKGEVVVVMTEVGQGGGNWRVGKGDGEVGGGQGREEVRAIERDEIFCSVLF